MAGLKKSQHLKLELKELQLATENFKTCIGKGGFGMVYKGELALNGKHTVVAVKRLSEQYGQGLKQFLTEIELLTGQNHPNLISLLGFCQEGNEKLLVYEYAARGSLDKHIRRSESTCTLKWVTRLKICVDAARGLDHLHRHVGKHQTIIHRDVKSANILLDANWVAKVSDFGLSKLSFAGLNRSLVVSSPCGTLGYVEPEYVISGIVTKESDIYSFGMVLFEVFTGRLCVHRDNDGFLLSAKLAKNYYEKKKLEEIIDPLIRDEMSSSSLDKFSKVAYDCLHDDREQRPSMDVVTKELEETVRIQMAYESWNKEEEYWKIKLPDDSEEIKERFKPLLGRYSTTKELFMLLHKGFFFDDGERFFSIDDDGKKCEMISAKGFVKQNSKFPHNTPLRLPMTRRYPHTAELNVYFQINAGMLSMYTKYEANLVFSFEEWDDRSSLNLETSRWVWIKWKCVVLSVSSAHFARRGDDGNFRTTLWHFFNSEKNAYFDIILNRLLGGEEEKLPYIIIHGLEFQPLEWTKSCNEIEEIKSESIPVQDLEYTADKELYSLQYAGMPIDNGRKWFLGKSTGEKCHMLRAVDIFRNDSNYELMDRISLFESSFEEGIQLQNAPQYYFTCTLEAELFSLGKQYGVYLVFKFVDGDTNPDNRCLLEVYCELDDKLTSTIFAHLNSREPIPIIQPKKKNTKLRNLWNMPKAKGAGVPKWCITNTHHWMIQRTDGWMEVLLCKPFDELEKRSSLNIKLRSLVGSFYGLIVQGIEFRPTE